MNYPTVAIIVLVSATFSTFENADATPIPNPMIDTGMFHRTSSHQVLVTCGMEDLFKLLGSLSEIIPGASLSSKVDGESSLGQILLRDEPVIVEDRVKIEAEPEDKPEVIDYESEDTAEPKVEDAGTDAGAMEEVAPEEKPMGAGDSRVDVVVIGIQPIGGSRYPKLGNEMTKNSISGYGDRTLNSGVLYNAVGGDAFKNALAKSGGFRYLFGHTYAPEYNSGYEINHEIDAEEYNSITGDVVQMTLSNKGRRKRSLVDQIREKGLKKKAKVLKKKVNMQKKAAWGQVFIDRFFPK